MSDTQLTTALNYWQRVMQLQEYTITLKRISIHQVCDDTCKTGHSFVGIHTDHATCTACLYHTRKLCADDLVHELIHVKYPYMTEAQVKNETERWLSYSRGEVSPN